MFCCGNKIHPQGHATARELLPSHVAASGVFDEGLRVHIAASGGLPASHRLSLWPPLLDVAKDAKEVEEEFERLASGSSGVDESLVRTIDSDGSCDMLTLTLTLTITLTLSLTFILTLFRTITISARSPTHPAGRRVAEASPAQAVAGALCTGAKVGLFPRHGRHRMRGAQGGG